VVRAPDMPKGRSAGHQPGKRPLVESNGPPATANAVLHHEATPVAIVRQDSDKRRKARKSRVPAVYASAYAPCAGRHLWGFAYVCPFCKLGHLGRAKTEEEISGPRRSRCGRLVIVRVARVYRGRIRVAA
jgi:hypothetical protein